MSTIVQSSLKNEDVGMNVRRLVVESLRVEPRYVTDQTNLSKDLGTDWLDRVELVIAIEDHFGIQLTDDVAEEVLVVGDLIRLIETYRDH